MNPENFNMPPIIINNEIDFVLFRERLKNLFVFVKKQLETESPEMTSLVISILDKGFLSNIRNKLDETYDTLTEESESLIDSPQSETLEILKRRKQIAEKLNEILEMQEEINSKIQESEIESLGVQVSDPNDHKKAEKIADSIIKKLHVTARPNFELN